MQARSSIVCLAALSCVMAGCAQLLSDWSIGSDAGVRDDGSSSGASAGSPDGSGSSSGVSAGGSQTSGTTSGGSGSSSGSSSGGSDAVADAGPDAGLDAGCGSLNTDTNCGACGYTCVDGRHCSDRRCTPAWLPMTTANAPTARSAPGAAIAGKLIVAGGSADCTAIGSLASGALYDPSADAWTSLPDLNQARADHTLVSSGTTVYAFGGLSDCANGATPSQLGSLEQWRPGDALWTVVMASGGPAPRYAHESAWTGSGLLVYGGSGGSAPYLNTGSVYDPVLNAWQSADCGFAGCDRDNAWAIVGQRYVRLWGGNVGSSSGGLQFDTSTLTWTPWTPDANFPTSLGNPADDGRRVYFPSNGATGNLDIVLYDRATLARSVDTATSPANLSPTGSIAWTGSEVVLWSGATSNGTPTPVGGRYQPPAP